VRSIRSPLAPPKFCYVTLSPRGDRVDAVFAFFHTPMARDVHRFHLLVLARHEACAHQGMGAGALQRFVDCCLAITDTLDGVRRIVLTAEAHKDNAPVHGLLATTSWVRSAEVNQDPNYENWELVIDVD